MSVQHLPHSDQSMTVLECAAHLKMSRTHLFKIVDRGDVPSFTVDGQRRITLSDVADLEQRLADGRDQLAFAFANADLLHDLAIEELARSI